MPVMKTHPKTLVRQYSLQSILNRYDEDVAHVSLSPQSKQILLGIRRELKVVMKLSEQRNRKNERKRHGHHQNHNAHSRSSSTNTRTESVIINRSVNNTEDAFKSFQKKCNLILNSLIDTNADDVGKRLTALFVNQKTIQATLTSETMDDKATQYTNHVCQQIVDNASIQAIYSQVYAQVFKKFVEKLSVDGFGVVCAHATNLMLQIVSDIDVTAVSKLNTKGIAKFTTYLYMYRQISGEAFHLRLTNWLSSRANNEMNVCEVLVHTFLTLAESKTHKAKWTPFVQTDIQPLWDEGTTLGMRPRIRLWDIRDAYICV